MSTKWTIGASELACTDSGTGGEPVLLIHAGGFGDWFTPLAATPALDRYRVINLVRAGYTDAPAPPGLRVEDHAEHTAALLHHLETGPAHVVAHSSGTTIALQLAVDHPELVRTLTLCEPPLIEPLADPADHELLRATLGPAIGAAMAATARGDLPAAFDTFMAAVCGPAFRNTMIGTLGADVLAHAENHCGYFFTGEIPAVNAWTFDQAAAARLRLPVLLVQGSASPPPVHRLVAHLARRLPDATTATIEGADHLMPLTAPAALAELIAGFCSARQPLTLPVRAPAAG